MENSLAEFEKLLKTKSALKTSIYDSKPIKQATYKPQDVLDTVFSQIHLIHQADTAKINKTRVTEKKSGFLAVSNKPVYKEVPNLQKFETQIIMSTQLITDTQLINIIENVEAIDAHKDVTQEFGNSFIHTHTNDVIPTVEIDKEKDNASKNKENNHTKAKKSESFMKLEEITHSAIHTEVKKSQEKFNETTITKNNTNTEFKSSNVDRANPQCKSNIMARAFPISHKEKDKVTVKTYNQTISDDSQSLLKNNTAYIVNTNTQSIRNDFTIAFTLESKKKRDKDTLTPSVKSSADSSRILVDIFCKLDEQLNTEDIANINNFGNIVPEFEIKNHRRVSEDINISKELFTEDQLQSKVFDKERPPSPVLNMKSKTIKLSQTPESFSVPLDVFENFEKTVISLVENNNKQTLINSQILGKELHLNNKIEIEDGNLSPVIKLSIDELHISQKEIEEKVRCHTAKPGPIGKEIYNTIQEKILSNAELTVTENNKTSDTKVNNKKDMRRIQTDSLSDEILFSSDEENDCVHNEFLDLPLTCALETSFYDKPDVLEKTMYVGFQTASNKSIQIQTETFENARSLLANDREYSLTELVEICDRNAKKINLSAHKDPELNTLSQSHSNNYETTTLIDNITKTLGPSEKQTEFQYVEFQTSHNNKNNISEKDMTTIGSVSENIDLTEKDLESEERKVKLGMPECILFKDNYNDTIKTSTNIQENNINDDLLIQEFENIEMSLEEKEANKIEAFDGFKTASNKKIQISEKAKLNINNIFKDIDLAELNEDINYPSYTIKEQINTYPNNSNLKSLNKTGHINALTDVDFPSTSKITFEGFKTANDKVIKISENALYKTKKIFENINEISLKIDKNEKLKNLDFYAVDQKFEGFKTASNKTVLVSKEAINKTKNLFEDLNINDNFSTTNSITNIEKIEDRGGMQLETYKKLKEKRNRDSLQNNQNIIPLYQGFKTASNKSVKVSEKSLAKSRSIFEDIKLNTDSVNDGKNNIVISKDTGVFKGFQTANNKPLIVSQKNLIRSRKIFAELDEVYSNVTINTVMNKKKPYSISFGEETLIFKGFTTANDTILKISEESFAKQKPMFCDFEVNNFENQPYAKTNKDNNPVFKEFQTANKKSVHISEDALRSKKMFQDIEHNVETDLKTGADNTTNPSSFFDFKTGDNKQILLMPQAASKTNNDHVIEMNKVEFVGFQTASNKSVKISKAAIDNTKNIFKDKNIDKMDRRNDKSRNILSENYKQKSDILNKAPTIKHNIFSTASNKYITVSEKALKKSKQLLTNSTNDDIKNLETTQILKVPVNTESKTDNTSLNIDKIINTQVLQNFDEDLYTEDFQNTPKLQKRSTSPILSCPRAKKRKFETPYQIKPAKQTPDTKTEVTKSKTVDLDKNYKKYKIYKLKDLKTVKNTLDPYITNFNIDNMGNFEFVAERNDITHTKVSINDIKNIFQNAVDTKIVPEGWFEIHIKLIIWKLLSYEAKFNFVCTVRSVLNQLKYRYDKELYRAERPALRKIMEKDDVPSKTLVLCVAGIYVEGVSVYDVNTTDNVEILLTDGWYFIRGVIDKMMLRLVAERKIYIGSKIVTCGAELVNCEQGVSPWEDTSHIKLKISGNSTRPAPWDTKLGYHRSAILSNLSSVKVDGGKICKLQVFVTRVYPLLYVEKFEDGSTVTRSERLEHLHQIKYENDREAFLEQIYEEVQREFSDQESQDSEPYTGSNNKRKLYDSGSQIAKMMKKSKDPMEFRAQLTCSQVQLLQDHTSRHRDRLMSAVQDRIRDRFGNRNVVTLLRGKIASVGEQDGQITVTTGMLSIWKPSDAILELFKENSWIEIMNLVPTAIRYSDVQLSAGRQSIFKQLKPKDESLESYLEKYKRKMYKIEELTKKPVNDNEIDTAGVIFLIDPSMELFDSTKHSQNVYLADENKNMICINFWGGIKKFGFLNVVQDTGQIISCVNLQKRAGNTRKNIPQFRVTEFTSLTKTPKNKQCREIIEHLNKKLVGTDRVKFCEDCVAIQSNYSVLQCFDENSPYRISRSDYNMSNNKMFIETPLRNSKKDEFNLHGLDFESSFKQTDTELSPNTVLRKKKVNERIAKLKMYGEPPPLSPINIINKSINAINCYKSPFIYKNNSDTHLEKSISMSNNVLAAKNSDSPIFNKIFVKRNVNPIKLDFSKTIEENQEVDRFSGDFDGSPPLSLE